LKPLRLGVVGTGPWGRNYARTIAGMSEVTLARVAGRADWHDLVRAGDVDAMVVAVPPAAQPEIALAAIEAGRPLLLEKPLALSTEAAERIAAAAAAHSVLVMVDHVHLFHPAWEELKRAAAQRGPVRSIEAAAGGPGPYRAGVSTLWDWGPHDVAMCLDLLGAPQAVDAECLEARPAGAGSAERLRLDLQFARHDAREASPLLGAARLRRAALRRRAAGGRLAAAADPGAARLRRRGSEGRHHSRPAAAGRRRGARARALRGATRRKIR
jgi:predicted dehydrogenase